MPLQEADLTTEEYLAFLISKEVRDREIVCVGTLSPVPLMGTLLAKMTFAKSAKLMVFGNEEQPLVDGSKELFDLAQRGKLGLMFLSGAQIDGEGNINLTCIGDYASPKVRLPGGAGSAMLYYMSRRTVLFSMNHTTRVFVPEVDFITSKGYDDSPWRLGGLTKVVTPLCVFAFNWETGFLEVESIHRGVTPHELIENTGFPINPEGCPASPLPTENAISLLRNDVLEETGKVYPQFIKQLKKNIYLV